MLDLLDSLLLIVAYLIALVFAYALGRYTGHRKGRRSAFRTVYDREAP